MNIVAGRHSRISLYMFVDNLANFQIHIHELHSIILVPHLNTVHVFSSCNFLDHILVCDPHCLVRTIVEQGLTNNRNWKPRIDEKDVSYATQTSSYKFSYSGCTCILRFSRSRNYRIGLRDRGRRTQREREKKKTGA